MAGGLQPWRFSSMEGSQPAAAAEGPGIGSSLNNLPLPLTSRRPLHSPWQRLQLRIPSLFSPLLPVPCSSLPPPCLLPPALPSSSDSSLPHLLTDDPPPTLPPSSSGWKSRNSTQLQCCGVWPICPGFPLLFRDCLESWAHHPSSVSFITPLRFTTKIQLLSSRTSRSEPHSALLSAMGNADQSRY